MTKTTGQMIPPPPGADEAAQHAADLAILEADPRTAGGANRPPWLVRRVLADAKNRTR